MTRFQCHAWTSIVPLAAAIALGAATSAHAALALVDLGHLDGAPVDSSSVTRISADGQVVIGSSGGRAFRWHGGTMVELVGGSAANGVNASGSVIVGELANSHHAFRWTAAGGMQDLGELPGAPGATIAYGVSADGSVVVGEAQSNGVLHAWIWNAIDGMQDIGSLVTGADTSARDVSADGRVVVGYSSTHAIRWSAEGGMVVLDTDLPSTATAIACAVDATGSTIVGSYNTNPLAVRNLPDQFRATASGMSGLWSPPWGGSTPGAALAVNRDGSRVVGDIFYFLFYASLWTRGLGVIDLNTWLPANGHAIDGWSLDFATGINANGDAIVGNGHYYDSTMPEAESRMFLITGLNGTMPIFADGFDVLD